MYIFSTLHTLQWHTLIHQRWGAGKTAITNPKSYFRFWFYLKENILTSWIDKCLQCKKKNKTKYTCISRLDTNYFGTVIFRKPSLHICGPYDGQEHKSICRCSSWWWKYNLEEIINGFFQQTIFVNIERTIKANPLFAKVISSTSLIFSSKFVFPKSPSVFDDELYFSIFM